VIGPLLGDEAVRSIEDFGFTDDAEAGVST
jgi:hypothetical protein